MSGRRRTLGAHLAWLVTLSTTLGLTVFAAVSAFLVWLDERGEDDILEEMVEDVGPPLAVAAPLGILVALAGARWAARRVTARVDALVATASRMTAADLDERLPLTGGGDELDDLSRALNLLFERIDAGVAALRRFAADASHELRTPLTVMINSLEVARRRPRDVAEWEQTSGELLEEARRMAELIEALLQSARSGAFDLATEPIDVDDGLETIAREWRDAATAAGVAIEVDASTGVTTRIDRRGLGIALGNLLANAIAHSPRGGLVAVRAELDERLVIDVDDQGPGVPEADRERVFTPFVRGTSTAGPARPAGVGLGLSIARRILEAHAGTLVASEAPGGGARFRIELPITEAS